MVDIFDIKDKVILFTGGYGYLGGETVKYYAQLGAKVYVLARNKEKFEVKFNHENIFFVDCDISQTLTIKEAFKKIYQTENKMDVLINNAFYSSGQSPENMNDEDFMQGIDGTLNSVFRCIREIIPYFKNKEGGKIINVSSMYGVVAPDFKLYDESPDFLNPPHYGAAKAGVLQLTKYYASYLGKYNINVNAITPGPFPSTNVKNSDSDFEKRLADNTLLNRVGLPEDLIGAFVLLASKSSNYITGQNIIIDGGWTSK